MTFHDDSSKLVARIKSFWIHRLCNTTRSCKILQQTHHLFSIVSRMMFQLWPPIYRSCDDLINNHPYMFFRLLNLWAYSTNIMQQTYGSFIFWMIITIMKQAFPYGSLNTTATETSYLSIKEELPSRIGHVTLNIHAQRIALTKFQL